MIKQFSMVMFYVFVFYWVGYFIVFNLINWKPKNKVLVKIFLISGCFLFPFALPYFIYLFWNFICMIIDFNLIFDFNSFIASYQYYYWTGVFTGFLILFIFGLCIWNYYKENKEEKCKKSNIIHLGKMGTGRRGNNSDSDNIYLKALSIYGTDAQLGMLQEECAELIVEVNHIKRPERADFDLLMGEIADVEIMLSQIKFLFLEDEYTKIKEEKIKALQNRLNLL